jgi:hypothetical protein
MSRWNSKQLVLDANLAMGSSDPMFNPTSGRPGDKNRRLLEAIWEEGHAAVFNKQLRAEWRAHAGRSATRWLQLMESKGLAVNEEGEAFSVLLSPACDCLSNEGERAALSKDFHLVKSALATGQLIVSNEVHLPRHVAQVCPSIQELRRLYYANPEVEGDTCRLWIKAGAEKDADRRIDAWVENHCAID